MTFDPAVVPCRICSPAAVLSADGGFFAESDQNNRGFKMRLFKQDATGVCLYVFTAFLLIATAAQSVYAQTGQFAFEAEAGTIRGDMALYPDPAASGGLYIDAGNLDSFALYVINALAGRYVIWARVLAPITSQNELYVSVDGGVPEAFVVPSPSPNHQWLRV